MSALFNFHIGYKKWYWEVIFDAIYNVFKSKLLNTVKNFSLNLDNQQRNWEIISESKSMWSCAHDEWFCLHTIFQWDVSEEHG